MIGQGISPFFHRGPSGPPPPTEVFGSSLVAWWNSDRSPMNLDGSQRIARWDDLSGNGHHFEQTESSQRPALERNFLNGKPVADLNGSQFMANVTPKAEWSFLHDGTLYTVLSVFKPGNVDDPEEVYPLLGTSRYYDGQTGMGFWYDDRSAIGAEDEFRHFIEPGGYSDNPVVSNPTQNDYSSANTWHHAEILADPSNSTAADRSIITADGQGEEKNNTGANSPVTEDPQHTLQLGMLTTNPGNGWIYTGQIAESLIIQGHPTQSQLDWWNNDWTPNEWAL